MYLHRNTSIDQQSETLQSLLSEVDAKWDTLTCTLEVDRQEFAALHARRLQLLFLLRSAPPPSLSGTQALMGHLATVEQRIRQVSQEISHKECQRRTLEYRFDEVRRALSVLQQQESKQHWIDRLGGLWLRRLLMKSPLRALWRGLHAGRSGGHSCPMTGPEEVRRETMRKFLL